MWMTRGQECILRVVGVVEGGKSGSDGFPRPWSITTVMRMSCWIMWNGFCNTVVSWRTTPNPK